MNKFLISISKLLLVGVVLSSSLTSCTDEKVNNLTVTPDSTINFEATNASEVLLHVQTDAAEWAFTAPEWLDVEKTSNSLSVRATDNRKTSSRVGRIQFNAGNAPRVIVPVFQKKNESSGLDSDASLQDENGKNDIKVVVDKSKDTFTSMVKVVLKEAATTTIRVQLAADPSYLNEYIDNHGNVKCLAVEASDIAIANSGIVEISAGSRESEPVKVDVNISGLQTQTNYLVSLVVKSSDGIDFSTSSKRINWLLVKKMAKAQKNVCCLEVNNTNPLNLLEYKLEDGTPFFDVAIIFAANIVYEAQSDLVRLNINPNVQALLDENETYIQALRNAGIEVQLGLMPHHTPAGLINLSKIGAQMFAEEVADVVNSYNLDGVFLDEEWSQGTVQSDKLQNPADPTGGLYLCYQLKKQMKLATGRDCAVSVFDVNWTETNQDKVVGDDGREYTAGDLIDFHMPNYDGRGNSPWTGMTLGDCTGLSIECNLGWGEMTREIAANIKSKGYGWVLWFGFHPQEGGGINNNSARVDEYIKIASDVFYGQKLATPTGYYKKIDEGVFDSKRYDRW